MKKGELDAVVANQPAYDEYDGARYVYTIDNYGIYLNSETPTCTALKDVNLRYALYWGLDRETVVKAVYPTALPSAYMYVPFSTMPDPADKDNKTVVYHDTKEAKAIRMDGHEVTQEGYDPDLAKEYFDKAYQANGNQKLRFRRSMRTVVRSARHGRRPFSRLTRSCLEKTRLHSSFRQRHPQLFMKKLREIR